VSKRMLSWINQACSLIWFELCRRKKKSKKSRDREDQPQEEPEEEVDEETSSFSFLSVYRHTHQADCVTPERNRTSTRSSCED